MKMFKLHTSYRFDRDDHGKFYIWCDDGHFLVKLKKNVNSKGYEFKVLKINGSDYISGSLKDKSIHLTNTIKDLNVYNDNVQYVVKCIIGKLIEYKRRIKLDKLF
jgi:hypothetical protein